MEDVPSKNGLVMVTVMMKTTIKIATTMVRTAVDPMSTLNTVQNVYASMKEDQVKVGISYSKFL